MKRAILIIILLAVFARITAMAQDKNAPLDATTRLENLRTQLREVKAQEADRKEQVRKLDVELDPANLERAFAQTPSLNPAELRDNRRRQLEGEKAKAQEQLASLAESRINLESAITMVEGELTQLKEPKKSNSSTTDKQENSVQPITPPVIQNDNPKSLPPTKKKKARPARQFSAPRSSVWKFTSFYRPTD